MKLENTLDDMFEYMINDFEIRIKSLTEEMKEISLKQYDSD